MNKIQLSYLGRRTVFPSGSIPSPIYVVGKCPSREENSCGFPMVGNDGRMLFRALEKSGVKREHCRISNVSYVMPPGESLNSLSKLGLPRDYFVDNLYEDILQTNPKVVLAVGEEALNTLVGKHKITKWRGSVLPFIKNPNIKVVPTIQPSFIRKGNWQLLLALRSDCSKLFKVWRGLYNPPERKFISVSRGAGYETFVSELEKLRHEKGFLSYDIEGWYPTMSCISFSNHPSYAVSVPLNNVFKEEQQVRLLELVRLVLENPYTKKVAHNMLFDNLVLRRYGIGIKNIFMDTMLAHHTVFQELPHKLDFIISMYTWENYYKDDRSMLDFVGVQMEADDYSCKDAATTIEIVEPLIKELEHYNLTKFFFSRIMPRVKSASLIQIKGMKVGQENLKLLKDEAEKELGEVEKSLEKTIGVNPFSSKQVCDYLYKELRIPTVFRIRKKDGERDKTRTSDDEALQQIWRQFPISRGKIDNIIIARKRRKEISTYLDSVQENGRLFFSINISGTVSGRYSVGKLLDGTGIPAHGIPERLRSIIVPENSDCVVWSCDSKQAESMVVTWISGEDILFDAFMDGIDTHKLMASLLFKKPLESITGEERSLAKTIRHATNYWMSWRGLLDEINNKFPNLPFSARDSKQTLELIHNVNPKSYSWGMNIREGIKGGNRRLNNCWGRMRLLLKVKNDDMIRSAISFIPQSTVGDLTIIASWEVQKRFEIEGLDFNKNYIFNTTHDELIGCCERRNIEKVREIVQKEMEVVLPNISYRGVPLSIPSEFKIGPNWRDLEVLK